MKFVKKENQMPNTTCSETVNVIPCHKRGYSIFNYRFSMSRVTHECIIFLFLKQLSNLRKQTYIYDTLLVYIYFACLSVVVSVSNKRQNGWTDRAQIWWTSHDPRVQNLRKSWNSWYDTQFPETRCGVISW